MLKNIDPLLNSELLGMLQAMGHGDVIALVDRNYPAASSGTRVIHMSGTGISEVARAVLSVLPVDTFIEPAVFQMGPVGDEDQVLEVHADFQEVLDAAEGRAVMIRPVERFDFYKRATKAVAVVATTEDRPYGCFLITKGVV